MGVLWFIDLYLGNGYLLWLELDYVISKKIEYEMH